MANLKISLTLKQAQKQGQNIGSKEVKGLFIWIGTCGVVDHIVGYHKRRGWIADVAYHTGNHWIKDLFKTIFDRKGFVRITRFI